MSVASNDPEDESDDYLVSKRQAWFAFAMTFALMLFDYIDRQVIVSLFPHIKEEWGLNDKQLGSLVSIISIVVAAGGIPVALIADRLGRVKSIVVMGTIWSLATIACMFTHNFGQLFAARALVGAGETGYGSVGSALISTLFPERLRSTILGAFFAAASLGSVLGVILGGVIASHWGWKAAFGVVGMPGLVFALLYMFVRDYETVELTPKQEQVARSLPRTVQFIFKSLAQTPTLLWACFAGAMQLITFSTILSWLPSFLTRFHGMDPATAGRYTGLVILVSIVGVVTVSIVADYLVRSRPRYKLLLLAVVCMITAVIFIIAFGGSYTGSTQFKLILVGGLFMNSIMGVIVGVVMDVIHPGIRSTGAAVLAVILNLFGLAVGPFLTGALSDSWGLQQALTIVPLFSLVGAVLFLIGMRSYDADVARIANVRLDAAPSIADVHLHSGAAS